MPHDSGIMLESLLGAANLRRLQSLATGTSLAKNDA